MTHSVREVLLGEVAVGLDRIEVSQDGVEVFHRERAKSPENPSRTTTRSTVTSSAPSGIV